MNWWGCRWLQCVWIWLPCMLCPAHNRLPLPDARSPASPSPPSCPQWPLDKVLYLAASAENGSEHPLARAVLRYAALRLEGGQALLVREPDSPQGSRQGSQAAEEAAGADGGLQPTDSNLALLADAVRLAGIWAMRWRQEVAGPCACVPSGACALRATCGQDAPMAGCARSAVLSMPAPAPAAPAAVQAAPPHAAAAEPLPGDQALRSVSWLAPITGSEALPGRGVKCWLACPTARVAGVLPALVAGRTASALAGSKSPGRPTGGSPARLAPLPADGKGAAGAAAEAGLAPLTPDGEEEGGAPGGGGGAVEVRLAIGNRRLMQEEGITLSAQARRGRGVGGGRGGLWLVCRVLVQRGSCRPLPRAQPAPAKPARGASRCSHVHVLSRPAALACARRCTSGCAGMSGRAPRACWWRWRRAWWRPLPSATRSSPRRPPSLRPSGGRRWGHAAGSRCVCWVAPSAAALRWHARRLACLARHTFCCRYCRPGAVGRSRPSSHPHAAHHAPACCVPACVPCLVRRMTCLPVCVRAYACICGAGRRGCSAIW